MGVVLTFLLSSILSSLSPSLWGTTRYRLKYCLKGSLNPKQPTNQSWDAGGGRVVRRCCVNFQCQGVLLIWITVGQGPTALAVGAGGGCLDIFLSSMFSPFFLPLCETARYRLKYCLKGPLNPKQPTNQPWMH